MKGSDIHALPLTPKMHKLQTRLGEVAFWLGHLPKNDCFMGQCVGAWEEKHPGEFFDAGNTEILMQGLLAYCEREYIEFLAGQVTDEF